MDYLETYTRLTTGQLLRLGREQSALTDDARRALEVELQRRGISLEQELARDNPADDETDEAPAEPERESWLKAELWTRLLIWLVLAGIFAALALLATGERDLAVGFDLTSQLVLVAILGCAASAALPQRWRSLMATALIGAAVLLVFSGVWVWRRL